ncbi:MAG: hypothetical protein QOI74_3147 [Micromonosporaceae bacterium]|jgi:O-antigen/teichoic acid export membrane protein|nr:hypothetical protein [Micromonosporaceae bacterium]
MAMSQRHPAADRALGLVARGGLANLAGAAFTGAAGLATTWLVAHGLGTAAAGGFFAATAVFVLAGGLAKLGTQTSLVYWPARLRALGRPDLVWRCLLIGLGPVAVTGTLIGVALWTRGGLLALLAPLVPAAALSDATLAATRGYRSMRPTVAYDRIFRPALQLVALTALYLTDAAPGAYALAWAAPYLPTLLLAAHALLTLTRRDRGAEAGEDIRLGTAFWRFSAPRALAGVAQLGLQRVDVILVAALAGLPAAALYAVAGRFVVLGQFTNQAISQSVQPRLAERLATGDMAGARLLYQQGTAWLVLATWPMYLLVGAYAPVYLALFGPSYRAGATITTILAATMLVATACGMVDMVLAMGGRTSWNLGNVALALAIAVGVDLMLIPRLGPVGAALGLAAAVLANNLLPLAQVWHALRLHPFGRATRRAGGLAVAYLGVPAVATRIVVGDSPLELAVIGAIVAAIGATGYLVAIRRLREPLGVPRMSGRADRYVVSPRPIRLPSTLEGDPQ